MWPENPEKVAKGVGIAVHLGIGEGFVVEKDRCGADVHRDRQPPLCLHGPLALTWIGLWALVMAEKTLMFMCDHLCRH